MISQVRCMFDLNKVCSKLLHLAQFSKGGKTIGQNVITIRPSRDISDVSDSFHGELLAVALAASDSDSNFKHLCSKFHFFVRMQMLTVMFNLDHLATSRRRPGKQFLE